MLSGYEKVVTFLIYEKWLRDMDMENGLKE